MSAAIRAQVFPQKRVLAVQFDDGVSLWCPIDRLPALRNLEASGLAGIFVRGHAVILPDGGHLHLADVLKAALDGHSWWAEKAQIVPCSAFCSQAEPSLAKG